MTIPARISRTAHVSVCTLTMLLSACGGGSSDPAPEPTQSPTSLSISGVVAKGGAISGATITAKCATGTARGISQPDGNFTLPISGGALPCALEAVAGTDILHSATTTDKANITPLTELMLAQMVGQSTSTWFNASTPAVLSASVTAAKVSEAQTAVRTVLRAANIDLSKAGDFVSDTLVAAVGNTAGNDQDKALDALAAQITAVGTTLAELSATVASSAPSSTSSSNANALATELLLLPASANCASLRATDYWVITSGQTGGAVARFKVSIDSNKQASAFRYTTLAATALTAEGGNLNPNGTCRFTAADGSDVVVAPNGVFAGRNPQGQSLIAIPVQAHTLAELAGDWIGFGSDTVANVGGWSFGYGLQTISATGTAQFTQACRFDNPMSAACTAVPSSDMPQRPVELQSDGSLITSSAAGEQGGPWQDRTFFYRSGQGDYFAIGSNVMTPNSTGDGSVSYATKARTLSMPTVGAVSNNWNIYFNWSSGASSTLIDTNTHTIRSVDTTAGSYVRDSSSSGVVTHPETLFINQPFSGLTRREQASSVPTSDGKTTNVRASIALRTGSGLSVSLQPYQDASRPARVVISVNQPN